MLDKSQRMSANSWRESTWRLARWRIFRFFISAMATAFSSSNPAIITVFLGCRGIANVALLRSTREVKVSLPFSFEWCLALDTWTYFLGHLKLISLISFGAHIPILLLHTLFLDAYHSHEGLQAQSQLLPSLEQVAIPSIPELEVLIDILAEARSWVGTPFAISAISRMHPRRTGPPIEVVRELMLDWLTNSVVDGIPGDSV